MKKYLIQRILMTLAVFLGVLFATFILMYVVPGDPVQNFVGQRASEETIAALRKEWGLDQNITIQFLKYIGRIVKGDLGISYFTHESVAKGFLERFPFTLALAGLAILIGILLGIPAGILSALHENTWIDKVMMLLTLAGISLPVFWAGILLLMGAGRLDNIPVIRDLDPLIFNIFLAAIVLGVRPVALLARITREQIKEILTQDFVMAACARGLSSGKIIFYHVFRNALPPILTALALDFGSLLSGAAITETIFGIPGIGKFALTGLSRRDYPVIMGMVVFSAFIFIMTNLVVDLIIPIFNPKLRKISHET